MDGLDDPRLQPWALISRAGVRLYEVIEQIPADKDEGLPVRVRLLNLSTMHQHIFPALDVIAPEWKLERRAPSEAPDQPPEEAQ